VSRRSTAREAPIAGNPRAPTRLPRATPRNERRHRFLTLVVLMGLVALLAGRANAQESELVSTRHEIRIGDRTIPYIARTGYIGVRDNETGEAHGNVFFISYSLETGPGAAPRPLTFLWNGGPGSNSVLVHLVGFGPRRIRDDAAVAGAVHGPGVRAEGGIGEPGIEDNPDTWIEATDLVFVDPVGTGFSRPTKAEYASEFYSVLRDIAATTEFVRVYRTRFDALNRPVFLAGESYGVWRAAGVAEALVANGQSVSGVILISGGIPVGPVASDAERTAMFVPNRTATAFYHERLGPDLQRDRTGTLRQAEQWARNVYAPALERGVALGDRDRDSIIAGLARFTGVGASDIDRQTLAMTSPAFRSVLLRDRGLMLARYDMRITAQETVPGRAILVRRYLQQELGFNTDLAYQGLETGWSAGARPQSVGARWEWDQAPPGAQPSSAGSGDGPPGGAQPWLRRAMTIDPSMVAFIAAGLYDSLNGCADNAWTVEHVDPALRANFTTGCYEGGHMMYDGPQARRALARDVAVFISRAMERHAASR
jgi:carboxypeptidase C (cathepsin A)